MIQMEELRGQQRAEIFHNQESTESYSSLWNMQLICLRFGGSKAVLRSTNHGEATASTSWMDSFAGISNSFMIIFLYPNKIIFML